MNDIRTGTLKRLHAERGKSQTPVMSDKSTPYCSFCLRSHDEVGPLVAGPSVYICRECAALCVEIYNEERLLLAENGSQNLVFLAF